MNKKYIPSTLHHLIPFVEKWGLEDDGYRDELVQGSPYHELEKLVEAVSVNDGLILEQWLCNTILVKKPTIEYIKFSAFLMAYDYAKLKLKYRTP
jgi:hypothetical protein